MFLLRSAKCFTPILRVCRSFQTGVPLLKQPVPAYYKRARRGKKAQTEGYSHLFLLVLPASAFALGTWQVKRRWWKLDLLAQMEARTTSKPVPLLEHLDELEDMEYYPVSVRGSFEHNKELSIGPRAPIVDKPGMPGFGGGYSGLGAFVVTPFVLENGMKILVNRGWVGYDRTLPEQRAKGQVEGKVNLVGLVRKTEKRQPFGPKNNPHAVQWTLRDVEAMADIAGTEPIFIDANEASTVEGGPLGGQTRVNLRNEHLSYIITWYSLGIATTALYYLGYIKR